jgi:hypothetical protein
MQTLRRALGPALLGLALTLSALLVAAVRRVPKRDAAGGTPLTDLAPAAPPRVAGSSPTRPPPTLKRGPLTARVPPADMPDPAHPPQWTRMLAEPGPPSPPDHEQPPPIIQDPDRGRRIPAAGGLPPDRLRRPHLVTEDE